MVALQLFHSSLDSALYYAIYFAWISSFIVERLIIRTGGNRPTISKSDRGSFLLIFLSIFGSITIANQFAYLGVTPLPYLSFYFGLILMVLGVIVRLWAVATLRNFFSYTVRIKEGHRVIDKGPYHFMRHPAYAGSLLTIFGVGFALQSWAAVLVMVAIFGLAFGYRIKVEEKALISSLGEEYVNYASKTKRLIPYVF